MSNKRQSETHATRQTIAPAGGHRRPRTGSEVTLGVYWGDGFMEHDHMRNFTVRMQESALRRVESTAKPFYGGRLSTGEAIRRLAEERLDEIESSISKETAQQALVRMLQAWRSGNTLPLSDLKWLAESAHDAYQRCTRDFVSRNLLVANVSAFRDAVQLATRGMAKAIELEERYVLTNLGAVKAIDANTVTEYVDQWIAGLEDRPCPMQAESASRSLLTYLRDGALPSEAQLTKTLAQYVPALLQTAIRGYWEMQHVPLIERPKGSPPDFPRDMRPITVGNIRLTPEVMHDGVLVRLEMTTYGSGMIVRHFVELEDLIEITRLASAGVEASAGTLEWLIRPENPGMFTLSSDCGWWHFQPKDFESLTQCLESLYREPWMLALVERLRYAYGRI